MTSAWGWQKSSQVGGSEGNRGKGKEREEVGVRTKMWRDRESGGWFGMSGASYAVLRRMDFMLMLVQGRNMLIQPTSVYWASTVQCSRLWTYKKQNGWKFLLSLRIWAREWFLYWERKSPLNGFRRLGRKPTGRQQWWWWTGPCSRRKGRGLNLAWGWGTREGGPAWEHLERVLWTLRCECWKRGRNPTWCLGFCTKWYLPK